jgi:nicotinate-nucleotide adenylyltransferase
VAFFGGSFDPPHLGHLAVARAAQAALGLDEVLFAPVGAQPLKPLGSTATFADRLAMTKLAIAEDAGFEVSLADAPRPGGAPNYTLETLRRLRSSLGSEDALFCLMGADSFFGLRQWHGAAEIPFAAALIVAARPGQNLEGLKTDLLAALPAGLTLEAGDEGGLKGVRSYLLRNAAGASTPMYLLPGLHIEISASQVREEIRRQIQEQRAAGPEAADGGGGLLPKAVFEYIQSHGLYR